MFNLTRSLNQTKYYFHPYQVRSNEELCEGNGFAFLLEKFPQISKEKLKIGIFNVPQIRELMKDWIFDEALSEAELSVWQLLVNSYKLPSKPPECGYKKEIQEFPPTWDTYVSQTTLSAVTIFQRTVKIWLKSRMSTFTKALTFWKSITKADGM